VGCYAITGSAARGLPTWISGENVSG
jgi:hypothetical protein